jgi:hypothetical protein
MPSLTTSQTPVRKVFRTWNASAYVTDIASDTAPAVHLGVDTAEPSDAGLPAVVDQPGGDMRNPSTVTTDDNAEPV